MEKPITPGPTPNASVSRAWSELQTLFNNRKAPGMAGYGLNLSHFRDVLPRAASAGYVEEHVANYVLHGLEFGFSADIDESALAGRRVFKNYKSAFENKEKVSNALASRVTAGKTIKLGAWDGKPAGLPTDGCTVPQGAVEKKLESDKVRPFSDHTATGFNTAIRNMDFYRHSLNTYSEIATELKQGYSMRVEDIDGAFPILPLAPDMWRYMYVWWYDVDRPLEGQTEPNTLYVHTFADFGTGMMPGIWDMFFRCVKAMARYEGVLTLPMPHYVDDNSLIGPDATEVDAEAERLGDYLSNLGVPFKDLKTRRAAMVQLVLGFWWDSHAQTRTLETEKLSLYLQQLREAANKKHVTLQYLQVLIGRLQRAVLTMPPAAASLLTSIILLTRGLKLPWHRRRLTAAARRDLQTVLSILEQNHGRGYYSYDHMEWAPDLYTDAAKETNMAGGGYVWMGGRAAAWEYKSAERRRGIAYLEGDAVVRAIQDIGPSLKGKRVRLFIDNSSFCYALKKGRSSSDLNELIQELFVLGAKYDCVFVPQWLASKANHLADAASRGDPSYVNDWWRANKPDISLTWSSDAGARRKDSIH